MSVVRQWEPAPLGGIIAGGGGRATPVVFLHGAGWAGISWLPQLERFAPQRLCLALDLPGHGASRHLAWTSLDAVADAVSESIARAFDEPFVLVGFSAGADVGIRLLARAPHTVAAAVLTGVSTMPVARVERWLDRLTWPVIATPVAHRILTAQMRLPAPVAARHLSRTRPLRIGDYANLSTEVLRGASLDDLSEQRAPVLALAGRHESRHARRSAARLVSVLPGRAMAALAPSGGHLWHVREPALFSEVVARWADGPGQLHPRLRALRTTGS